MRLPFWCVTFLTAKLPETQNTQLPFPQIATVHSLLSLGMMSWFCDPVIQFRVIIVCSRLHIFIVPFFDECLAFGCESSIASMDARVVLSLTICMETFVVTSHQPAAARIVSICRITRIPDCLSFLLGLLFTLKNSTKFTTFAFAAVSSASLFLTGIDRCRGGGVWEFAEDRYVYVFYITYIPKVTRTGPTAMQQFKSGVV